MSHSPEFLQGYITREYDSISAKGEHKENPTETCGSDCSAGDCGDETCAAFPKKDKDKDKDKPKKKAFYPVVEGWNEPPAARL
jgi:hypothetical protein